MTSAAYNSTTWSPGVIAGTWWPGTSTARTGVPSASTASGPAHPPAPASPLVASPAAPSPPSSPADSATTTAPLPAGPAKAKPSSAPPAAAAAPFAQDGTVEGLGSRHRRLVLGSWSWTGLAATVGRSDTDVEVVGPPRPATAFGNLATSYAHAAVGIIEAASAGQRAGRGGLAFRRYSWVASVQ